MKAINQYTLKKILVILIWVMMGSGTVVLLIAAIARRNHERCSRVEIYFTGQQEHFIDRNEIMKVLESSNGGSPVSRPVHEIDISAMEERLAGNPWIRKVELYFDNNDVLRVHITEREPVARIFTTSGETFYIDTSLARLPWSDRYVPRVPVFTGFPQGTAADARQDSLLLADVRSLGVFLADHPFWMAQIDQVDITDNRTFDLVPELGSTIVHFGDAGDYRQKFSNLFCFYRQVLTRIGWDYYAAIDAQFSGQIVGVRKNAVTVKADAARSVQLMKAMVEDAQQQADDSTRVQLEPGDDEHSDIRTSREEDAVPSEDVVREGQKSGSVTPVHVPEKPVSGDENPAHPQPTSAHSRSIEKPNPNPAKVNKTQEPTSRPVDTEKKIPKAVMPPPKPTSGY